ncbi:MAG: DUF4091 domain-containing protein [Pirellulales bacterium]|nr:DUF4091 domain-containing protein [Pirellulales bacterium]
MSRSIMMLAALIFCSGPLAAQDAPQGPRPASAAVNLALGKTCAFSPSPNYSLCTDAGDAADLTDGKYNGCLWQDKGTVGWNVGRNRSFTIDLDLASEQPVSEVHFDTVTGGSQVTFPSAVLVFISSNGKEYRYLGDVLAESQPQEKFLNHRFVLEKVKGWGRYVRLAVLPAGFYVFCDEIEVRRGEHTAAEAVWADEKPLAAGEIVQYAIGRKPWVDQKNTTLALLRLASEAVAERRTLGAAGTNCDAAMEAIEDARGEVLPARQVQEADYWQGPPYRSFDRAAFAAIGRVNAVMWPESPVRLWQDKGWTWLKPLAAPLGAPPTLRIDMMGNERACASFNITSASDAPQELQLEVADFDGPRKLPAAQVLSLGQIVHTEAFGYNYRDDAIVPVAAGEKFRLPAGLSKRIWLTFKTRGQDIQPGDYRSTIVVRGGGKEVGQVPLRLRVWPIRFPDRVTCASSTWGYYYEKAIAGRELEASQNLRDHYNTSLVINHNYLPYPAPDKDGNFTVPLDFSRLDQMIAWYPDCPQWLLWAGFEFGWDRLGLPQYGGPVWERVFRQWVTQIRDHLAEKGIGRERFAWYWMDEPGEKAWIERCLPASKLLKQIDPQMRTWENPTSGVTARSLEEARPYFDIYCPSSGAVADGAILAACRGNKLPSWIYACASEKNSDPFAYYRWMAWKAYQIGFGGVGMWVYVDENCGTFSDYTSGVSYALIYGGPNGIVNSKRWEAWRQGIGDFEYLTMLRTRMNAAKTAGAKPEAVARAERLLSQGVDRVVGDSPHGGDATQPQAPDELRLQILECLQEL